jgi:hypothetical protein
MHCSNTNINALIHAFMRTHKYAHALSDVSQYVCVSPMLVCPCVCICVFVCVCAAADLKKAAEEAEEELKAEAKRAAEAARNFALKRLEVTDCS